MIALWFGLGGAAAGAAQVWLLGRSAGGRSHAPSVLTRLLLVAGVLAFAAAAGHVISAALGWLMGFVVGVAATLRRFR